MFDHYAKLEAVNYEKHADQIRQALKASSAQKPLATETILVGAPRRRVEAALLTMYQRREVCCCKIIRGGHESIVWWVTSSIASAAYYGRSAIRQSVAYSKNTHPPRHWAGLVADLRRRGWKLQAVAKAVGAGHGTVRKWIDNAAVPRPATCLRLEELHRLEFTETGD